MATPERKELKAGWKNEVEVKSYNLKELSQHSTKQSLWIAIHGKVYDITAYARDHPGGAEPLLEVAGKDATSAYEDVGHSEDAREIMHGYLVGVLEGAVDRPAAPPRSDGGPTVKVMRKTDQSDDRKGRSALLDPKVEAVALAIGAAGLAWGVKSLQLLPVEMFKALTLLTISGHSSFAQGFVVAMSAVAVGGVLGTRYLHKAAQFGPDFSAFPSHKQSASPRISDFHPSGVLNPATYHKFFLSRKDELADGVFKFVFALPTKQSTLGLPIGQHVAIRATVDGEHTVVRSYTPVSNNRDLGRLELIIRVYPAGLMGNYLKSLDIGDAADIRGPKGAMRYRKGMNTSIGMVGGGTGITPLFQLIRAICEDDSDPTQITLIYGNRSESDIMLRERLDHFAKVAGHKFKLYYTLDQPASGWKGGKGRVTKELLEQYMPVPKAENKVLLCGPPGMVNAAINSLTELGFERPGAVSKMGDQVFCF